MDDNFGAEQTPLQTPEGVRLFGIRHLSAAGAWHVRRFLDRVKPELVLIESPHDAESLIDEITGRGVKPPLAVLCYTTGTPPQSLLDPLARYSPEYQALLWAKKHRKKSGFIDLPSNVRVALSRVEDEAHLREQEATTTPTAPFAEALARSQEQRAEFYRFNHDVYAKMAELNGDADFESYWERTFEHNTDTDSYLRAVAFHSTEMRRITEDWEHTADPLASSITALREAYMRRRIMEGITQGTPPNKIAAIVGAHHVSGLMRNAPMSDAEFAALPQRETRVTLMPYTYYRLSSFSGYGAGNVAPAYFEMLYDALEEDALAELPSRYITELSRLYRKQQGYASTASAIEAVRVARSLQYLHGGLAPALRDLHDSAITAMAGGDATRITGCFAELDVGIHVGSLPAGVSRTAIQDDFYRQLKTLKLEAYKQPVAQDLELDLRENRRVKSEEAAFRDLRCSVFLHRLMFLSAEFCEPRSTGQDSASFRELWRLKWSEEVEIRIVEAALYGDTVEAAAAYHMKEALQSADDAVKLATLVRTICDCELSSLFFNAVKQLQAASSLISDFTAAATAAWMTHNLAEYGSVRRFDTQPVVPVLQQLFLKAALLLHSCATCDDKTARDIIKNMDNLHIISRQSEIVNDELWLEQLKILARADDRNPIITGFALAILLERNEIASDDVTHHSAPSATDKPNLAAEISRRFSPGNTPEWGAAWFEGLSLRNHAVLLQRAELWRELDAYLTGLDDEHFTHALVSLRRAFTAFDAREKSRVCEILAELWGVDANSASETLQSALSEHETSALDDLKDLDLGDLL
ncbi:MAG: DUF5682 family protein [Treponema sp.]|jgi:hypothetical protein|nr:DUF5682 family protein [Treponema sp.]